MLLRSGGIVAVGGFGCSSASPVHGRLDDVLLLKPYQGSPDWECKPLLTAGKGPGRLIEYLIQNFKQLRDYLIYLPNCPLAEILLCSDN